MAARLLGLSGGVGASYLAVCKREEIMDGWMCLERSCIVGAAALATIADYRRTSPACIEEAHERAARRFRSVADSHGGIFVKLGQHVSSLNRAVPEPFVTHLSGLRDSASPSDPDAVRSVVTADLQGFPFKEWSREPIASASIAQVHAATTMDGQRVAVKVIHPGLERKIRLDLMAIRACSYLAEATLVSKHNRTQQREEGDLELVDNPYSWVLPDFETALNSELDLVQEATVMERCGELIKALGQSESSMVHVKVPKVRWDLTRRRVLTTRLVDQASRVDQAPLQVRREVASLLVRTHAFLMLQCGIVHADPHGANAIIAERPSSSSRVKKYDLYILDFGLCRRFDPSFRRGLCGLWRAVATRDEKTVRRHAIEVGIDPEMTHLLFASADRTRPLGTPPDVDKLKKELQKRIPSVDAVSTYMACLPRDLLFVLRSTSLLRALSRELGLTSRERYVAFALAATRGFCIPHHEREKAAEDDPAYFDSAIDHIVSVREYTDSLRPPPTTEDDPRLVRVKEPFAPINQTCDAEHFVRTSTRLARVRYRLRIIAQLVHFAFDFSLIEGYIRARIFTLKVGRRLGVVHFDLPSAAAIPADNRV